MKPDGVLVVDKPRGPTSHDVVSAARRLYRTRDVGHAGTLDPMATGVLVLLFGEATKLSGYLTAEDKRYRAVVAFGTATDTLDADGSVTERRELPRGGIDRAELERALDEERCRTQQVPPVFSAISVGGKRAHRLGRGGQVPQLAPRAVAVRELALAAREPGSATLELVVSKGYYVRALARDLGERLGVPAHLAELRRLASGSFTLDEAVRWPLEQPAALLDIASAARRALPHAVLSAIGERRARQGRALGPDDFEALPSAPGAPVAWLAPGGELVALGEEREPGVFRVVRGFSAR